MSKSYKEDHRPALQFYINDWLAEPGLNMCSLAAQGLWIKMICYMFKSDFRGCLKANGKQITPKQLSKLCSESEDLIIQLLKELDGYEVYSTLEDGTIYSRRMYRQTKNEREISQKRSDAGKQGGRPPKKQSKSKDKANKATSISSSTSTSSSTVETIVPEHLELATLLQTKILENIPTAKITDTQIKQWCDDVRLMITCDNRTLEQIKFIIGWCQSDSFWFKNILSMGKLRKQFDKLVANAKGNKNKNLTQAQIRTLKNREDWINDRANVG